MPKIGENRLIPWSLARYLAGGSEALVQLNKSRFTLSPVLFDDNHISLFKKNGLIFSDDNLIKAIRKGFAFPKVFPIFFSPCIAAENFKILKLLENFYCQSYASIDQVMVLLRASLEACAAFANYHVNAKKILEDESGLIVFSVVDFGTVGWIMKKPNNLWETGSGNLNHDPSATITFKNLGVALKSTKGQIDHMVDPAIGNVMYAGKLPLLDKFGFISRMAFTQIPRPST